MALEKMLTRKCPLGCPSGQAPAHRLQSQDFRTCLPPRNSAPTILSYRGQAACSVVLQSLDPGLLTPQNVLTTEMNTPNLALPPQSLGHAPRPPIVAAEFRGWGDLKPSPCSGPATCASVQRTALLFHGSPFLYIACYLTLLGLLFLFLTILARRSFPLALISWVL